MHSQSCQPSYFPSPSSYFLCVFYLRDTTFVVNTFKGTASIAFTLFEEVVYLFPFQCEIGIQVLGADGLVEGQSCLLFDFGNELPRDDGQSLRWIALMSRIPESYALQAFLRHPPLVLVRISQKCYSINVDAMVLFWMCLSSSAFSRSPFGHRRNPKGHPASPAMMISRKYIYVNITVIQCGVGLHLLRQMSSLKVVVLNGLGQFASFRRRLVIDNLSF
ncbi:hypothetical protein F4819DRAFT_297083 [Hypoxylon fuscum]|nr:hypothetical protein F4819DRAFT_297083 [Hypoxylon fuscum]